MKDKQLVQLAAKAVGIEGMWVENSLLDGYYKLPTTGILTMSEDKVHIWNPLTSCGDAFRLMVKLHMLDSGNLPTFRQEETSTNPQETDFVIMRRAIVQTAAALVGECNEH